MREVISDAFSGVCNRLKLTNKDRKYIVEPLPWLFEICFAYKDLMLLQNKKGPEVGVNVLLFRAR